MNWFHKITSFLSKVFTSAPSWTVTAKATLNLLGPLAESVIILVDPGDAKEAQSVITEIQADLGTASAILSGAPGNLSGTLGAVSANLQGLITAGHIKNPDSVAKASAAITAITGEIQAILAAVPAAA
jgi:hypothetical protein